MSDLTTGKLPIIFSGKPVLKQKKIVVNETTTPEEAAAIPNETTVVIKSGALCSVVASINPNIKRIELGEGLNPEIAGAIDNRYS